MDRRDFLRVTGRVGALAGAGAAGWSLHGDRRSGPLALTETGPNEADDRSGLRSGRTGAYGVHRMIYSVPMTERLAALTFDDGPDPEFTPRVLDVLASYKIKATFLVMGYNALHHTDILKETVAAGHEIGNHTWTHRDLSTVDATEAVYEIRRGREVIESASGLRVRFFRPPRGELSGSALRCIAEEGNDLLLWSITGSLPAVETPTRIDAFVESHLEPGSIIDFHDGIGRGTFDRTGAGARALIERRTAEIAGLPKLIESALARDFAFLTVSDLLTHESPQTVQTNSLDNPRDPEEGEPHVTTPPAATMPHDATVPPPTRP